MELRPLGTTYATPKPNRTTHAVNTCPAGNYPVYIVHACRKELLEDVRLAAMETKVFDLPTN